MSLMLAGAGVALYFGVYRQMNSDEAAAKAADAEAKAFDFKKDDAKTVTLTAKGATTVIEKEGDDWRITSPIKTPADKFTIDAIVSKLVALKAKNLKQAVKDASPEYLVATGKDRFKDFGLDQPKFSVKVGLKDGKTATLLVGSENPYDQSLYYTRGTDGKIFLADSSLKYPLDKGLFDLRDKAIVTQQNKDVQALTVSGNGLAWTVERDGGGWKLTLPIKDKADKSEVEGVLSKLSNTRAKAFPLEQSPTDPKELAKYGFDSPAAEVIFAVGADRAKKTLQITSVEDGGVKKGYARLVEGGPIAEVDPNLAKDILKSVATMRDKTVAPFEREKVAKLEIFSDDGSHLTVDRTKAEKPDGGAGEEKFTVEGHPGTLKSWRITSALYTLGNLKGASIADENATDLSKYGLDKPKHTFVVLDREGKELSRIIAGDKVPGQDQYYVMKAGDSRVYQVEKSAIDGLPKKPEDVLESPPKAKSGSTGGVKTAKTGG